ncbi:hypothetical protein BDF19DRAFT_412884 [Syncephalis fuscata]|nr:hypothetical protein BDF19DRAFT_412884 [Syncephalis fuscata]
MPAYGFGPVHSPTRSSHDLSVAKSVSTDEDPALQELESEQKLRAEDNSCTRIRILQQIMHTLQRESNLAFLSANLMARLVYELPQIRLVPNVQIENELDICVNFLLDDDMEPSDIAIASHWLRESPDRTELRKINAMGLVNYRAQIILLRYQNNKSSETMASELTKTRENTPDSSNITEEGKDKSQMSNEDKTLDTTIRLMIDPRLVAAHLKYVCQQFPYGLITDPIRDALLHLMPSAVRVEGDWKPTASEINTIRMLLQIDTARFHLLGRVMQVTQRILKMQKVDRITPVGLAVLLPVTSGSEVTNIILLKRWHVCLGTLMSCRVWDICDVTPIDAAALR